jgi:YidC/Oxa1 family membrane protein insertase
MSSKDNQRRSLAFLVIFFLGFIYIEKVLTPFLQGDLKKKNTEVASTDKFSAGTSDGEKNNVKQVDNSKEVNSNIVTAQPDLGASKEEVFRRDGIIKVLTGVSQVEISKKGGRLLSVKLNNFKKASARDEELYEVIVNDGSSDYPLGVILGTESDSDVLYSVEGGNVDLSDANSSGTVTLKGTLPSGKLISKTFTFHNGSYLFDLDILSEGSTESPYLLWTKNLTHISSGGNATTSTLDPYGFTGFVSFNGEVADRTAFADMKDLKTKKDLLGTKWLAVGDKYFASAIVSPDAQGFSTAHIERLDGSTFMKVGSAGSSDLKVKIFSGPKSYTLLNDLGFELRRLLDLGKTGIISGPLLSLLNIFYKLVGNYGLAIVLLTIVVKLVLYQLNTSQFKQMKAMQALKPELDRIKETITDKQQQQMALMNLYKTKGVNPLGGCLPVLVQMPIFIGLYSALSLAVELRHADFGGWVHDLSSPDALMIAGIAVPMLVILFTLSMLVQQWITPSTMDPQQKKVMMIMPIFMFFMFKGFPAGLAVYWLTNNLISIGQQQGLHYNDRSGKSGFKITGIVAVSVFLLAYVFTLT